MQLWEAGDAENAADLERNSLRISPKDKTVNLETRLEPRLWEAVRTNIEGRNFKGAILDSIHLLSDVIRERSGLDGDGVQLVGAAFGGNSPKLKVNKLQSESEQNVQRGVEALLRGLYQAIRNPRSHGTHTDDEATATTLILFVGYLLRVVDQSKSPFNLTEFVGRVFEPDFVPLPRYAELLLNEMPGAKSVAVAREIFTRRGESDRQKVAVFIEELLKQMSPEEIDEVCEMISDELRQTDDEDTMRFVLAAFPPDLWPRFSEIARLRVEHKLIASIKVGKRNLTSGVLYGGAFGTWATGIVHHFILKEELWRAIAVSWRSDNAQVRHYALHFFGGHASSAFDAPPPYLALVVNQRLKAGDSEMKTLVEAWTAVMMPISLDPLQAKGPWIDPFKESLRVFKAAQSVNEVVSDDDIPF